MAASCAAVSSHSNRIDERQSNGLEGGESGEYHDAVGCHSDAAIVLHLDLDELVEEAADSMREKLQLTAEEWNEWKEQKEGCLTTAPVLHPGPPQIRLPWCGRLDEKRNRLRFVLKQRFDEWAVRPMARLLGGHCALQS